MKKIILSFTFILVMALVFIPNMVKAATNSITIKPKDTSAEYSLSGKALVPTEFEVIGDLIEGDEVTDVTYKGSQTYTGSSESEILSYKIMRGNVDVTSEYQVSTGKGTLTVSTFGMPEPSEKIEMAVGEIITKEDLEILLGVDGLTASHSGIGSYSLDGGFTSNTTGKATLIYTIPGVDKGGDSQFEISPFNIEIEISVLEDKSQVNYSINVEDGIASVNDVEQYKAKAGETVVLTSNGAPEGKEFDKWEITGVTVSDLTNGNISFVMPSNNVTAKALYKDLVETSTEENKSSIEEYNFIDDTEKQEFKSGKLSNYVIKINADYDKFESLAVNGVTFIKDVDYIVTKGSTIITFTDEGLKKLNELKAGEHEISVKFDGEKNPVIAKLTISEDKTVVTTTKDNSNINNPQTGDNIVIVALITLIAFVGMIATIKLRNNKVK